MPPRFRTVLRSQLDNSNTSLSIQTLFFKSDNVSDRWEAAEGGQVGQGTNQQDVPDIRRLKLIDGII